MHWTISDNWEWADGYCPKFGLAAVDRSKPSLPRTLRGSYHLWARICRERRVSRALRRHRARGGIARADAVPARVERRAPVPRWSRHPRRDAPVRVLRV